MNLDHIPAPGPRVLGIDLSSHALDLAYVDENDNTATWSRYLLDTPGDAWARTLGIGNLRSDSIVFDGVYLVAIEAPYGRGQAGTQAILNRVVGAIAAVMPSRLRKPEACWLVRPDEWKHGLGLKAKPTRDDVAQRLHPQHAHEQLPHDQNALDAACLALWARDTNAGGIQAALNPPKGQAA